MGNICSEPNPQPEFCEQAQNPSLQWDPDWAIKRQLSTTAPGSGSKGGGVKPTGGLQCLRPQSIAGDTPLERPSDLSNTVVIGEPSQVRPHAAPFQATAAPAAAAAAPAGLAAVKERGPPSPKGKGKSGIEMLENRSSSSRSEGHSGTPQVRRFRREIAEQNYDLRRKWYLPITVPTTWAECVRWRSQAPAQRAGPPDVTFSGWSTADALHQFASQYGRSSAKTVCGLNFANGVSVGGGYKSGALAQEEDLCRRLPMLYSSLINAKKGGLYPFGPPTFASKASPGKYSDVLFTPDLTIARRGEDRAFEFYPESQQHAVALVSAAAPNLNFGKEVKDLELMYKAVQTIISAPFTGEPQTEVLVLGAWGCGAFGGDPYEIGELFARALRDGLCNGYRCVHFAIPRSATDQNADVFRRCLQDYSIPFKEL